MPGAGDIQPTRKEGPQYDVTREIISHLFTPGEGMCCVEIHMIESHSFYDDVGAIASGFTPRELTVFADVHMKHDQGSFLARDGRFFVEHFKSTDLPARNNAERRSKLHDLAIICTGEYFVLDRSPFENVYLEQSMDFCAELQKFYDQESSIQKPWPVGSGPPKHYWSGLYKQLPQGASVTQVLYASLPRIGRTQAYWTWAPWARPRTRPLSHFYFRTLPAK